MALLTSDIVWLTTQTITLSDGSRQQVLVPQVYLRRLQGQDLQAGGSLIAASDVNVKTPGDLINSGTIQGERVTAVAGNNLSNLGGTIQGERISLRAGNDLANLSGTIRGTASADSGSTVALSAGRDLIIQTRSTETSANTAGNSGSSTSSRSNLDRTATVQGGSVTLAAGRDLLITGAAASADSNLLAIAGRDITVSAVEQRTSISAAVGSGSNAANNTQGRSSYVSASQTTQAGSTISAGNNLTLIAASQGDVSKDGKAAGAIRISGSDASAGNNLTLQGADISIAAGINASSRDDQSVSSNQYRQLATSNQTLTGGTLSAGNNLTLNAVGVRTQVGTDAQGQPIWASDAATGKIASDAGTGNITITGGVLTANANTNTTDPAHTGQVSLIANNNVLIQHASTDYSNASAQYNKSSNLLSSSVSQSATATSGTRVEVSVISGANALIMAGNNLTVTASGVLATNGDTALLAGNKVLIGAAAGTETTSTASATSQSGLMSGGGLSVTIGNASSRSTQTAASSTQTGSLIAANGGNLSVIGATNDALVKAGIAAGDTAAGSVTVAGSTLTASTVKDEQGKVIIGADGKLASGNLTVSGTSVDLQTVTNTEDTSASQQQKRSGLTIGISSPVLDAVGGVANAAQATASSTDPRDHHCTGRL
jgi:filamentous hemagglutinin